jgi:GT2 family glycosyltransferase
MPAQGPQASPSGLARVTIAPAALADKLRRALPQWALAVEEPGLARYLAARAISLGAEAGDADLIACGAGLALWSWQRAPLDRPRQELLAQAMPGTPAGAFAAALLERSAPRPGWPEADDVAGLVATGDVPLILRLLMPGLRHPEQCLAWLAPAWDGLLRLGSADLALAALDACALPPEFIALKTRLRAEAEFLYSPEKQAIAALDGISPTLFGGVAALLRGELLLRLGEERGGRETLAALFSVMPWHTQLGLKLHDLASPPPTAGPKAAGRAVICVYSWNKAELVRQTLESLAATDVAGARILCLDNGSTDGTADAMRRAAGLFAPGALRVVGLPVNIGAPAARNWLLAQPEAREAEFAVFLDDDVLLPPRWLGRLLGALEAEPRAGAAGCRIVSATPPPCLQSADYHLFMPDGAPRSFRELPENVNVFDNCAGALDVGLFTYARPAAHVSGCCHALRTEVLRGLGGFDIRFSPTQFDDLDRDLRAAVAGRPAVYRGDVAVAHVQHSSLARAKGPAAMGQVMGNKIKLEGKFTREEAAGVAERGLAALWADMAAKWGGLCGRQG